MTNVTQTGAADVVRFAHAMRKVSDQADTTLAEARRLITERAAASRCSVDDIATAVIDRSISFSE